MSAATFSWIACISTNQSRREYDAVLWILRQSVMQARHPYRGTMLRIGHRGVESHYNSGGSSGAVSGSIHTLSATLQLENDR